MLVLPYEGQHLENGSCIWEVEIRVVTILVCKT